MPQEIAPNVVIFSETGVGKSSIINMMLGSDEAKISPDATGCTFDSTLYDAKIRGRSYNLYDTIGLGEGSTGTAEGSKAIGNLYSLLSLLSTNGGVHLLIFVVRCGRLTENIQKNYELFYKGFCETKVPIVVVVTGCEGESKGMHQEKHFFPRSSQGTPRAA
ncbi:P-loop containing nucleoside triphosphate hydrolase protein [Flammula alnicola]|nr:P-loop containing nucleoside triphosphate hydrolase protein [Flammula alnicola]